MKQAQLEAHSIYIAMIEVQTTSLRDAQGDRLSEIDEEGMANKRREVGLMTHSLRYNLDSIYILYQNLHTYLDRPTEILSSWLV
jgi:hypothetical protein